MDDAERRRIERRRTIRVAAEATWVLREAGELAGLTEPELGVRKAAYERRKAGLLEEIGCLADEEPDGGVPGLRDRSDSPAEKDVDAVRYRIAATDLDSEPVIVAGVAFRRVEARDSDAPGWSTDHE